MRQQLIQYVELFFAGAPDSEEIKMEILQNTLDRYDDLVSQGKSPEAAYRLAISGIGDVNEILGNPTTFSPSDPVRQAIHEEVEDIQSKKMRAAAVALYILSPVPLFILSEFSHDTIGLCMTLLLVAAATVLIMMSKNHSNEKQFEDVALTPKQKLHSNISNLIWLIGVVVYFIVSFLTHAWYITWIIFLIAKCVICLVNAILDFKEAVEHEN